MSRRDVGRLAVAAAASAVMAAVAPAEAQPAAPGAVEMDARVGLIEKAIGRTLTEEQRKAVSDGIKGNDEAWARSRAQFAVADGTEPDFIFRPTPLPAQARPKGDR